MQLDYTTCAALKEAGYPQKGTILVLCDGDPEMPVAPRVYVEADNGHPRFKLLACPVSDELLAAMQERWPDVAACVGPNMSIQIAPPGPATFSHYEAWDAFGSIEPPCTGPTPAEALANLYITLAGGQPCS